MTIWCKTGALFVNFYGQWNLKTGQAQCDLLEEELDVYEVGGFLERWSQTPSYTKSKRDRDWRIK